MLRVATCVHWPMAFRGKSGKLSISVIIDTRPHSHTHTRCSFSLSHACFLFFSFEMHIWIFQKRSAHVCTLINLHELSKHWVTEWMSLTDFLWGKPTSLCFFQNKTARMLIFNSLLSCCGWFSLKSWLITSLSLCLSPVSVEPGVWLSLEGAHRQVLFASGLHIWLPGDGCHGWLVSCLFYDCFCLDTASVK